MQDTHKELYMYYHLTLQEPCDVVGIILNLQVKKLRLIEIGYMTCPRSNHKWETELIFETRFIYFWSLFSYLAIPGYT